MNSVTECLICLLSISYLIKFKGEGDGVLPFVLCPVDAVYWVLDAVVHRRPSDVDFIEGTGSLRGSVVLLFLLLNPAVFNPFTSRKLEKRVSCSGPFKLSRA